MAIASMEDKTTKLTSANQTLRKNPNARIPVDSEPGQCIERFLRKLSPNQERLYCRVATEGQKKQFAASGYPHSEFSPKQPLGKSKVGELTARACQMLGFPTARGHGFRRLFISTLANNPRVSVEESMRSSRHSSVSAQLAYQERNGVSESGKFAALGIEPSK